MGLHCAATLLIARHGDAAYGHADPVMSDDGGWLTELGRRQVVDLAASLRAERVSRAYGSPLTRASESAAIAGATLGVDDRVLPGLEEVRVGNCAGRPHGDPSFQGIYESWVAGELEARIPGGESGQEVLTRFRAALQEIADLHRGEQVLVFSHGGIMAFALPQLCDNLMSDHALGRYLPNAVPARIEVGDDGWYAASWPGSPDRSVV